MNIFKSKAFKIIMPLISIVLVFLLYVYGYCFPKLHRHHHAIGFALDVLQAYIDENEGNMPESEEILIEQGLLRKKVVSDRTIYEGRIYFSREDWIELPCFKDLIINYGIKFSDIEIRGQELVNKESGDPILLINGPPAPWPFRSAYHSNSEWLYKYMSSYHNKKEDTE